LPVNINILSLASLDCAPELKDMITGAIASKFSLRNFSVLGRMHNDEI
jgi:hypothetical protein